MTALNVAYLALAVGAWFAFAIVVGYVTHLTNPSPKHVAKDQRDYLNTAAPARG